MCFIVTSVKKLKLTEFRGKEPTQATISWGLKRCKLKYIPSTQFGALHYYLTGSIYSHSNYNLYNFIIFLPYVDRFEKRIQPIEGHLTLKAIKAKKADIRPNASKVDFQIFKGLKMDFQHA